MLRPESFACALVCSLASCHLALHDGITVDGVRLEEHHEEVLAVEAWPAGGLSIDAHQGDLRVEPGEGVDTITVELFETQLGRAHASLEDGRLVARAEGGEPCAIGRVVVRTRGPIPGLSLATGLGDVEILDVPVEGALAVKSGMGDLDVRGVGAPKSIELSTGMGDVALAGARCEQVRASSGMGDVRVEGLESPDAELSSGLGDLSIVRSRFERVKAETGLGDIDCRESSYETSDFDSGLGSVRTR